MLFPFGSHTRSIIERELRARGAPLEVVAESHQPEVLREMVRLGAGWTVLPDTGPDSTPRSLVRGPVLTTRQLVIARRAGSIADPAADELADRIRRASP